MHLHSSEYGAELDRSPGPGHHMRDWFSGGGGAVVFDINLDSSGDSRQTGTQGGAARDSGSSERWLDGEKLNFS